jgi:hypothetical protein
MAGVHTDQRLNLSKLGKAFGRKPRFQTGPGKSGRPGGGFGKRKPWWDCEPVLQSKEQERKPLIHRGTRPISIPVRWVIAADVGQPVRGEEPFVQWKRQRSCDGTSRMMREYGTSEVRYTKPTFRVHQRARNCTRSAGALPASSISPQKQRRKRPRCHRTSV